MRIVVPPSGFTLMEIVIVLTIVGLVFGIATIAFNRGLPSTRLEATAREISAAVRHARALALTKGESQTMAIDLDARTFGIRGRAAKVIPRDISIRVIDPVNGEKATGVFLIAFRPSGGYECASVILKAGEKEVRIDTDPVLGSTMTKPGRSSNG